MADVADLANLALVLILASAVSGLWLRAIESVVVCALAVMAFNWEFVPPLGTFSVHLRQHAWLLATMLGVGSMVAWLMGRQRMLAETARNLAEQANLLRSFNEQLRVELPDAVVQRLATTLQSLTHAEVAIGALDGSGDPSSLTMVSGDVNSEEMANLRECMRTAAPATFARPDIHGYQGVLLPLRGQQACYGAVLLRVHPSQPIPPVMQATTQGLCDQMGLHCERTFSEERARCASEEAQTQMVRNTLLAAISHDYRTPLATILGCASSLLSQSDRLSVEEARGLAKTIVDEVEQLGTMTENTLELARLDTQGVKIVTDWESLEELVGSCLARVRGRYPDIRMGVRIEPQLPLLRCDAQLIVQLLNNLIDNAVKYGDAAQIIEITARRLDSELLLAVGDRGLGIQTQWRERLFLPFERGLPTGVAHDQKAHRGAGLGLALCRAIVTAHGGRIQARHRQRGGTSMECLFPFETQPLSGDENSRDSASPHGAHP